MTRKRLLINWVYYPAIGHTIEALRYVMNFRRANPDLLIGLALNARAGVELAGCVPGLDSVYPVRVEAFEEAGVDGLAELAPIPREWDYLLVDPRHSYPMGWAALDRCETAFQQYIRAGVVDNWSQPVEEFPPGHNGPLELVLPQTARDFAQGFLTQGRSPCISMVLGSGAEPSRTPPLAFWKQLVGALLSEYPNAEVYLLGALRPAGTTTQGITRAWIEELSAAFPQVRDAFDLGLLNQLAIAQRCDLHISPHTGMSFAVQCVGTPWLVISGGDIAENIVNGVPFASIYPDCDRYPCGPWFAPEKNPMLPECEDRRQLKRPFLCLSEERLMEKLPNFLESARALIRKERPYLTGVEEHYQSMLPRLGRRAGEPFMDGWPDVLREDYVYP
jgi:hypothetical protein